jgi:hypothetical protein
MKLLTEEIAAEAYAKAWNTLDPVVFCNLLAENACYASQWVFEELTDKRSISEYLTGKMQSVKERALHNPSASVQAEVSSATNSFPGRACVVLKQGGSQAKAVVIFEVGDEQIKRFDLCIPELLGF